MNVRRILSLVFLWQLAASICYYTVFAATPFFRDEFGLSGAQVGLVLTALSLGYAAFLLPLGAMTDRFGERRMLTIGLIGLSIGSVLVAGAWSYPTLLIGTFLLGSLYGTAMPGTNKAIFDNVPVGRQNLAVGIKQVGVTAGSGASALLVTGIAGILFWEAGFYVAAAVGIVVAAAFWIAYRGQPVDDEAEYPEYRALLDNTPYLSLTVVGVCLGAGLFTTTGYTIIYINESVGATVSFGGLVLAAIQVSGSAGRVVTGWLSDVLPGEPRRRIGTILLVQAAASAVLFVAVGLVDSRLLAAALFVGVGFFALGFTGIYFSCMATLVPAEEMGSATGGGQLALVTGALVAPPTFGYLSDVMGYRASWFMLAGLSLFATLFIVRVIRQEPPTQSQAAVGSTDSQE
ncbi:sugar phosphate permease [Halohasta litchfieldiae]|jgi:predicted MFS family arabinose efflux permease|uniref:Sugar phosphate permease n=1 Tax=Halohasta litchfieldiae TaxID=1073996 RepID=A0A1H6W6E1_9EURY|nr:MFS transporter [Halohasta litchfieldiae]ATW87066.1 sugar phosphate permease [Halohasta litchfieldiae]SEJ12559.1 Sugar phosphate permease [Halohasta litchfieldiae]